MYEEAKLITITKNILLLHHVLQEIAEIEPHKKILDCISRHLSELNLLEDVDLLLCLNEITKIEAKRRTRGLPTTGKKSNANKNNRVTEAFSEGHTEGYSTINKNLVPGGTYFF